ncbi:MAG: MoaD/ThiS family protein [Candidatus Micrarchaeota archaeon]|nr:MoaD/ThiS family protein [Candidatus Micrarchaeota archaeon]
MQVILDGRKAKVKAASSVGELISVLGLAKEEVLVKVNGKLASDRTPISKKDKVKVMRVIFGG